MEKIRILTLIGGSSRQKLNKMLLKVIKDLTPKAIILTTFDISKLSVFSEHIELDPPEKVIEFKDRIREADAILIITSEYSRNFPKALKNALDWSSRPHHQNQWDKRPVGVMGLANNRLTTFSAKNHLRQVLHYMNAKIMTQPEFIFTPKEAFNEKGELTDEASQLNLKQYLEAFCNWINDVGEKPYIHRELNPVKKLEDSSYTH